MAFCKVFEDEKWGQILCMKDAGDDGNPVIKVMIEPEGLGICSAVLHYKDTDEGWDTRDQVFADVLDEKFIVEYLQQTMPKEILDSAAAASQTDG